MTYVVVSLSTYFLPELFLNVISSAEKQGLSRDEQLRKAFISVLGSNVLLMVIVMILSIIYKVIEIRRTKGRVAASRKVSMRTDPARSVLESKQASIVD